MPPRNTPPNLKNNTQGQGPTITLTDRSPTTTSTKRRTPTKSTRKTTQVHPTPPTQAVVTAMEEASTPAKERMVTQVISNTQLAK